MSTGPADGFVRSSGTVTLPHRAPSGHGVSACAAVLRARPPSRSVHVAASALAALRMRLAGRSMRVLPFVVVGLMGLPAAPVPPPPRGDGGPVPGLRRGRGYAGATR